MTTTLLRRLAAVATTLVLTGTLAACAGDEGSPQQAPSERHNAADTRFAQMMIVHHEGAIEMSELAQEKAESPEVRELAEGIGAAQTPEIELMSGWLQTWGEEPPEDMDMGGMDHGGGMDMEGMDQGEAMGALDELDGAEFDRRFLELMTDHHRGAIEMAEEQLADGESPQAIALARDIIDAQTAEIAQMQELLDTL